jgi:hypothetical protein
MLMYYDARPGTFNCLFDYYTMRPLKGYYAFHHYARLYELGTQVESTTDDPDLYAVAAKDGDRFGAMIVYYTENDNKNDKYLTLDVSGVDLSRVRFYVTDRDRTFAACTGLRFEDGKLMLRLARNTILYMESV